MTISRKICSVAAFAVAMTPVVAGAAPVAVGTVNGKNAVVARDGHLLAVTSTMPLYAGDRIVTRAGGAAQVAIAGACTVNMGASAMVVANKGACVQPTSFDQGRAGYAASGSALQDGGSDTGKIVAIIGGGGAAGFGLYEALKGGSDNDDDNDPAPVSP